jgi:hypothetical protein
VKWSISDFRRIACSDQREPGDRSGLCDGETHLVMTQPKHKHYFSPAEMEV